MIAIAIDGPAGAGKSTMAKKVAGELGFIYVDTGALYRVVGYAALQRGLNPKDAAAVGSILDELTVELRFVDGEQRVFLCGADVSQLIRTPEVSMAASDVSAHKAVRDYLFSLQRDTAKTHNVVMDGRDIGTVVLPDAKIKIFLTASAEDRAQRRYEEMLGKGQQADYDEVLRDLQVRDSNDSSRAIAPLKPAPDAVLLDTTGNELETSVALILGVVKEKML